MVEEEVYSGRIEGADIFFLTDNGVSESMYNWVNLSNQDMLELLPGLIYL